MKTLLTDKKYPKFSKIPFFFFFLTCCFSLKDQSFFNLSLDCFKANGCWRQWKGFKKASPSPEFQKRLEIALNHKWWVVVKKGQDLNPEEKHLQVMLCSLLLLLYAYIWEQIDLHVGSCLNCKCDCLSKFCICLFDYYKPGNICHPFPETDNKTDR